VTREGGWEGAEEDYGGGVNCFGGLWVGDTPTQALHYNVGQRRGAHHGWHQQAASEVAEGVDKVRGAGECSSR
jgi:hypothetical protein